MKLEPKSSDDNMHAPHHHQMSPSLANGSVTSGHETGSSGYSISNGYLTPPKSETDAMVSLGHTVSNMTSPHNMTSQHMTSSHMTSQHHMTSTNYLLPPSPPKAVPVTMDDSYAARHHLLDNDAAAAQHAHSHAHASSIHMQVSSDGASMHAVSVGAS